MIDLHMIMVQFYDEGHEKTSMFTNNTGPKDYKTINYT